MKKFLLGLGGVIVLLGAIFAIFANWKILQFQKFVVSAQDVPNSSVALVFGGGMTSAVKMSDMQTDRVLTAVRLYKMGKVPLLMMTGDNGEDNDDEVDAMKNFAVEQGVPSSSIVLDPHGYRTYESCYREKNVYGVTTTIAISQSFHLARIIYFCQNMGIHTVGVAADRREYGFALWHEQIREFLARLKGWWQVEVSKPMPRSLEK